MPAPYQKTLEKQVGAFIAHIKPEMQMLDSDHGTSLMSLSPLHAQQHMFKSDYIPFA